MNKPLLLDGTLVSREITKGIEKYTKELKVRPPKLTAILTTDNFASHTYVKRKIKACSDAGITSQVIHLEESPKAQLLKTIEELNNDDGVDGILIQLPLRKDHDLRAVLESVDPKKDVDGFHPINMGKLVIGDYSGFIPCTPQGILTLLNHYKIPIEGENVVIIGRSIIVGRPLALLLSQNKPGLNATVTLAHSKTHDLIKLTRSADIIVAACGSPRLIRKEHIRQNCVLIDVGINRVDEALCGDVHEECYPLTSAYSPVPGGIGPMTIASLLSNTALSHARRFNLPCEFSSVS